MPLPAIPKALYPLVPKAPGVPALLRSGASVLDTLTLGKLGIGSMLDNLIGADPVKWGVFNKSGKTVALADSVVSVEYSNSARVSSYPVEEGAFASYNKVADPFAVRVRMSCGGAETARSDFVEALDAAANSIDLFDIVTPEKTYIDANIERVDWSRTQGGGSGLVVAEIFLIEVRQSATAKFANTKAPAAADGLQLGQIQALPLDGLTNIVTTPKLGIPPFL